MQRMHRKDETLQAGASLLACTLWAANDLVARSKDVTASLSATASLAPTVAWQRYSHDHMTCTTLIRNSLSWAPEHVQHLEGRLSRLA